MIATPAFFVTGQKETGVTRMQEEFVSIRPGGQREPLLYDPKDTSSSP